MANNGKFIISSKTIVTEEIVETIWRKHGYKFMRENPKKAWTREEKIQSVRTYFEVLLSQTVKRLTEPTSGEENALSV